MSDAKTEKNDVPEKQPEAPATEQPKPVEEKAALLQKKIEAMKTLLQDMGKEGGSTKEESLLKRTLLAGIEKIEKGTDFNEEEIDKLWIQAAEYIQSMQSKVSARGGNPEEKNKTIKAPETKGEYLEQQMQNALTKLENAETSAEKFAAVMALLAIVIQFLHDAIHGGLDAPLDKTKERKTTSKDAHERVVKEFLENNHNGKFKSKSVPEQMGEMQDKKEQELRKNTEDTEKSKATLTEEKGKNTELLKNRAEAQKSLNEIKKEETDPKILERKATLEKEMKEINEKIKASDEKITALENALKKFAEEKKQLEEDREAIGTISRHMGTAQKILEGARNLPLKPFESSAITVEKGKFVVVLTKVSEAMKPLLKAANIDVDNKGTAMIDIEKGESLEKSLTQMKKEPEQTSSGEAADQKK